jgi:hypothetical protein
MSAIFVSGGYEAFVIVATTDNGDGVNTIVQLNAMARTPNNDVIPILNQL